MSTLWTRLCRELGIEYPIGSVGMGMVAGPELAAAVSNAGGFAVFGTHDLSTRTIQVQVGRAARMQHLQSRLAVADVTLDEAVLDRIDEIVPPGTTITRSTTPSTTQPSSRPRRR